MTLRWWFEWSSLEKVGLQAGLYSGNNRPDLKRTPHALHSVFAPKGPALHCGVFWTPQWLHRRVCDWTSNDENCFFFFCLLTAFSSRNSEAESHRGLEWPEEEEEVAELEEELVNDGERENHKLTPVLGRLVLILTGRGALKQDPALTGVKGCLLSPVNQTGFFVGAEYGVKESSTKLDNHSSSAKSSV